MQQSALSECSDASRKFNCKSSCSKYIVKLKLAVQEHCHAVKHGQNELKIVVITDKIKRRLARWSRQVKSDPEYHNLKLEQQKPQKTNVSQ